MKTAISLSEETALYMGIPRSKLFAMALEEFISKHNGKMITEKINQTEFDPYLTVGLESLRNITKNDTW